MDLVENLSNLEYLCIDLWIISPGQVLKLCKNLETFSIYTHKLNINAEQYKLILDLAKDSAEITIKC